MTERGGGRVSDRVRRRFDLLDDPDDVADGNAPPLSRQAIAALRPALAGKNPGAHQRLENLLEIAPRNPLAARDGRGLNWLAVGVVGDVEDRLDGEEQFLG